MRAWVVAGLVAGVCGIASVDAFAGEGSGGRTKSGMELIYTADAGETNRIEIATTDKTRLTDQGVPLVRPPATYLLGDCSYWLRTMTCPSAYLAILNLGDKDDSVVSTGGTEVDVTGGAGNDTVRGDGRVWIIPGPGADDAVTSDFLIWDYQGQAGPMSITLDGVADDGPAGEGDNVRPGTDEVVVYDGDARIVGDDEPNYVRVGGTGSSTLIGGGGSDLLSSSQTGGATMRGDAGNDHLSGTTAPDDLEGGEGSDSLQGSWGPGDRLDGGPGDDYIGSLDDGDVDTVTCGDGDDSVTADTTDIVASDCETVRYGF